MWIAPLARYIPYPLAWDYRQGGYLLIIHLRHPVRSKHIYFYLNTSSPIELSNLILKNFQVGLRTLFENIITLTFFPTRLLPLIRREATVDVIFDNTLRTLISIAFPV